MHIFKHPKQMAVLAALFSLCFLAGRTAACFLPKALPAGYISGQETASGETPSNGETHGSGAIPSNGGIPGSSETLTVSSEGSWGLSFAEEGKTPAGNATADYLKQFNAYYAGDPGDKVIYLTFDAGYENGNTPAILDALKKHRAPAAFFLVGNYLNTSPDLVKRMVSEGHTVGNHTFHHPDMSKISTLETFSKELTDLEALYQQVTGMPMAKLYRPPQGKYSESNLRMAKELGYQTFFWSMAYVDWYEDRQPAREEALKKLTARIHPGAVVLLHSTSKTNGEILDDLLTAWENMGYRFGELKELYSGT